MAPHHNLHRNMLIKCQMPATDVHYVIIITQARFTKRFMIAFYNSLSQIIGDGKTEENGFTIYHTAIRISLSQYDLSYYAQYYKSNAFNWHHIEMYFHTTSIHCGSPSAQYFDKFTLDILLKWGSDTR